MRRSQECCQSIFFFPRNTSFLRNPEHFQTRRDYSDTFFLNKGQVVFHVLPVDPATILGFRRKEVCHSHPADEETEAEQGDDICPGQGPDSWPPVFVCVCLFVFFFGYHTACGVPGPGIRSKLQLQPTLDPSTRCARLGIEPAPWRCRDTTNSIAPQREFLGHLLLM